MKYPRGVAFTLLELLVVLVVVITLAAIAVPNFLEAQVRSKVTRARAETVVLAEALEAYYADHLAYPPNLEPFHPAPGRSVQPVSRIHLKLEAPDPSGPTPPFVAPPNPYGGGMGAMYPGMGMPGMAYPSFAPPRPEVGEVAPPVPVLSAPATSSTLAASDTSATLPSAGPPGAPPGMASLNPFSGPAPSTTSTLSPFVMATPLAPANPFSAPGPGMPKTVVNPFAAPGSVVQPNPYLVRQQPYPGPAVIDWETSTVLRPYLDRYGGQVQVGSTLRRWRGTVPQGGNDVAARLSVNGLALTALTTPVAYLGYLPADTMHDIRGFPFAYFSYNPYDASSDWTLPAAGGRSPHYLLCGWGPDTQPTMVDPYVGPFVQYDPTNGTVSNGDLLAFDGMWWR